MVLTTCTGYIGPTSSWAFCRRVLAIVGNHTPWPEAPVHPWDLENIDFSWTPIGLTEQPDVTGLPSYDHALYMLASVEYNLATLDCIIDYVSFRENLEIFYEDLAATAMQNRLWYSQFLLVLAFGESFTSTGPATGKVPGIDYASRALSLIPNLVPMNGKKDSLAVVQAHCLAALYLQAIDLRLMAFQMVRLPTGHRHGVNS